ncbi:MAG TPA: HEAT repeat domain-containing protein, partial [Chloroflexia bacterium]
AVSPLIALLEDSNTDVCAAAVEALGTLKNSRALPTLRRMQQKWAAQGTEGQFLADTARQAIWQIEGHV